jgi:hypothetical protein
VVQGCSGCSGLSSGAIVIPLRDSFRVAGLSTLNHPQRPTSAAFFAFGPLSVEDNLVVALMQ